MCTSSALCAEPYGPSVCGCVNPAFAAHALMVAHTTVQILEAMDSQPWRVVVVRAWLHDGEVAAVLLVGAEPGQHGSARRVTTGSVEAACAALATILEELTAHPTNPTTTD